MIETAKQILSNYGSSVKVEEVWNIQMYKVIIVDNLNRDYKPQGLVTMAMSQSNAIYIADLLNSLYTGDQHAKVVPANQPLNLESCYDLAGETLPYERWLELTGAAALPQHVAEYWYNTTIVNSKYYKE